MDFSKLEYKNNIIYRSSTSVFDDEPSLGHLIVKSLTNAGDKTKLIHGISGEKVSGIELVSRSINISKALLKAGIQPGDVVSIVSENRFEFAYILFGTIFLNCTSALQNPTYSEKELDHAFNLSKPKIIFVSNAAVEKVSKVVKSLSFVKKLILINDGHSIENERITVLKEFTNPKLLQNVHFALQPVDKWKSICLTIGSGGTTGPPKGVQLSQGNIMAGIRHAFLLKNANLDYEMVILGFLPLYHLFGAKVLIGAMADIHTRIIFLEKFEEDTFLGSIEKYRCTTLYLVPPLMMFLSKSEKIHKYDLKSVRVIHCGAAPLSIETVEAVRARLQNSNMQIKQLYGMSELSGEVLSNKEIIKPGSVGEVNSGVSAKVIDENGTALGPNRQGELCFKGAQVMAGYIGNDEATIAMIDKDGWLHTGDVGYYDEELQFYIVDRIKELIKWNAFQVSPSEIEGLLLTHPKIKDCGVIGKPDETVGELPMAFVVRSDPSLSENDVINFANKDTSPAKKLRGGVIFVDEIPKNPSGKMLRRELRELLQKHTLKSKL